MEIFVGVNMNYFIPVYAPETKIKNQNITNGNIYFSTDSNEIFADIDNERLSFNDIIFLPGENDRKAIIAPKKKLYIVVSTGTLWIYTTEWKQLNQSSSGIVSPAFNLNDYLTLNIVSNKPDNWLKLENNVITIKAGTTYQVPCVYGENVELETFYFNNKAYRYYNKTLAQDKIISFETIPPKGKYIITLGAEDNYELMYSYGIYPKDYVNVLDINVINYLQLVGDWGYNLTNWGYPKWEIRFKNGSAGLCPICMVATFYSDGTNISNLQEFEPKLVTDIDLVGVVEKYLHDKQDKLKAGAGITISPTSVISTSAESYTAGENIFINNSVISATDTKYTAGKNIQISSSNEISAIDTLYGAGTGITITNHLINVKNSYLEYSRLREGIWEYPENSIYFEGNTIYFKTGLKLLQANGRNTDNTYKNSLAGLTSDLTLKYAYLGNGTTPIYGTVFIRGNKYTMRVQNDYIYYQEEQPPITTGFISAWYKPSEHKWYFATGSATTWLFNIMCPVCDFVYDRSAKVFTSVTPHEVVRMITYQEYKTLKDDIEILKSKIIQS